MNYLTALRHFAAVLVILAHSYVLMPQHDSVRIDTIFGYSLGSFAVNLFFVISGYLIYQSLCRTSSIKRYVFKRFIRVFPGLLFCVMFTYLYFNFVSGKSLLDFFSNSVNREYLLNIFLVGKYNIDFVFDQNYYPFVANGSLWTLRYEILMYIIVTVMLLVPTKFRGYFVLFVLVLSLFGIHLLFLDFSGPTFFTNFVKLIFYFFVGVSLNIFGKYFDKLNFLILTVCLFIVVNNSNLVFIREVFLASLFVYAVKVLGDLFNAVKKQSDLHSKGEVDISYGLYIYAFPVQQVFASKFVFSSNFEFFLISLLGTLPFAILSWFFIEKQFLKVKL